MIEIKEISTYMLDSGEGLLVGGYREKGVSDTERDFLCKKIEKLFSTNQRKEGILFSTAWIMGQLQSYQQQSVSFSQFAENIAQKYYKCKREWNLFAASSLIIALVAYEQVHYLVMVDQGYKNSFCCIIDDQQQAVCGAQAILSNTLLKNDFGFTISMGDHSLQVFEQKQKNGYVMSEHFLQATVSPSYAEVQQAMEENVRILSEKYEMNTTQALTTMKRITKEHVEEQEELLVEEMAEEIFHEVPYAAEAFCAQMQENGVRETIPLEGVIIRKKMSTQSIKTDTGIEITFPVEYMDETDKLEIVHQPSGTIEITIKNVTHLQNR